MSSDIIECYLSQMVTGYIRERGRIVASVVESVVRYRDGRVATVVETRSAR